MPSDVPLRHLVDIPEIAARCEVSDSSVRKWHRDQPDFPAPVKVLRIGAVWDWRDVNKWWRKPRPRPSRARHLKKVS